MGVGPCAAVMESVRSAVDNFIFLCFFIIGGVLLLEACRVTDEPMDMEASGKNMIPANVLRQCRWLER